MFQCENKGEAFVGAGGMSCARFEEMSGSLHNEKLPGSFQKPGGGLESCKGLNCCVRVLFHP